MANVNAPQGLQPVGHLLGLNWTARGSVYYIAASDGNAYAPGDPVVLAGGADARGVPSITLATGGTGNQVLGAFMAAGLVEGGPYVDPTNLNTVVVAAGHTAGYYAYVLDDPYIIWEIQEASDSARLAATDVGNNANLVTGTNNGYVSGWMLSEIGLAVTATLQLRLLGLVRRGNNAFGQYAKWLCLINNHCYRAGVAGV